jgi:hypothetical protein
VLKKVVDGLLTPLAADYAGVQIADNELRLFVLVGMFSTVRVFTIERKPGEHPALSLHELYDSLVAEWNEEEDTGGSRRAAIDAVLRASTPSDIGPKSIVPVEFRYDGEMAREEKQALRDLQISREALAIGGKKCLDSAFRRMARQDHPDREAGSGEKFKKDVRAKEVLDKWLELQNDNEKSSRKGKLGREGIWCFVGKTKSWVPPK